MLKYCRVNPFNLTYLVWYKHILLPLSEHVDAYSDYAITKLSM